MKNRRAIPALFFAAALLVGCSGQAAGTAGTAADSGETVTASAAGGEESAAEEADSAGDSEESAAEAESAGNNEEASAEADSAGDSEEGAAAAASAGGEESAAEEAEPDYFAIGAGGIFDAEDAQKAAADGRRPVILAADSGLLRENGAILVNQEGKRFVNELETDEAVSGAILAQPDSLCYLVFDQNTADAMPELAEYIGEGLFAESDTMEGLAKKLDVDPEELVVTMEFYAGYQEAGNDPEFGRGSMASELVAPDFYAVKCLALPEETGETEALFGETETLSEETEMLSGESKETAEGTKETPEGTEETAEGREKTVTGTEKTAKETE